MADEVRKRLDALCARFGLDSLARRRMEVFLDVLETDARAPTAVTSARSAVDAHLADALVGLDVAELGAAGSIADIGSGAGAPGLPLAIARPDARVRLVESQARKAAFLLGVIERLGLANVEVVNSRVEEWTPGANAADAVTARALAPTPVVLEYAAPLLRVGGVLVDWRGRRETATEHAAVRAAAQLGMELVEIRRVEPFAGAAHRHLHVYRKREETPARFPRRAGIARKRPLGGS
jgi:16S rRNA (guanine527-N7)-methyltransferase